MAMADLFSPIFDPLLELGPLWTLLIISFLLSVLITLIYKWMTNQDEMKQLKAEIKESQKKMKQLRNEPKKMMEAQKKAMETNSRYMMKSMRPTLVTFLPIIIIFGWLGANLAFLPIEPSDQFSIEMTIDEGPETATLSNADSLTLISDREQKVNDEKVKWDLRAKEKGIYNIEIDYGGKKYYQKIKVSDKLGDYENPEQRISDGKVKMIETIMKPIKPFGDFTLFGWKPGWLGAYIIFSMIFSLSLRKLMKLS